VGVEGSGAALVAPGRGARHLCVRRCRGRAAHDE
jgi:hypothetical protein